LRNRNIGRAAFERDAAGLKPAQGLPNLGCGRTDVASYRPRARTRWSTGHIGWSWCVLALAALAGTARAESERTPADHGLAPEDLSLETLLNPEVWVATKSELHASRTPAVVTVISGDEILAHGYTCLADVLRSVPGFYDVYDGVTHNVGVRGINGGQNASGSSIKLMIDGQAVDYRINSGNFFGEELIPIELIERVEIIRGPASALYGADAFLGAINVVTRSGESLAGARMSGQGAMVRNHPGGGGGLVMGGKSGPVEVVLGASYLYLDRSGLTLPASSPLATDPAVAARGPTEMDRARPASALAKVAISNVLSGTLSFLASIQLLDAHGEYQYYGPLDDRTRLTLLNQTYRLGYTIAPSDAVNVSLSAHYFNSAPTPTAQLALGRDDYLMVPSARASGSGATAEVRLVPHRLVTVTAGTDVLIEDSATETFDQKLLQPVKASDGSVLRTAGTIIPGEMRGEHTSFRNVGALAQAMVTPTERWSAIAGLRLDDHNIYGARWSARAGVVYEHEGLSLKLLYGSSFKAPSPEQLYARPVSFGGVLGNPDLHAQTAQNLELAAGLRLPSELGDVQVNGYLTDIRGRVEFLPTGSYIIASNTQNERVVGGELTSHLVPWKRLRVNLMAGMAHTVRRTGMVEGLLGKPVVTNPLFPEYQLGSIFDALLPWAGLRASVELDLVGPREGSFSNAVLKGSDYDTPAYVYSATSLSAAGPLIFSDRPTRIALRVSDLLNARWTEPGFGGVDIPTQGITVLLTVSQGF
jgi:iron complex outermembrane receptor protein